MKIKTIFYTVLIFIFFAMMFIISTYASTVVELIGTLGTKLIMLALLIGVILVTIRLCQINEYIRKQVSRALVYMIILSIVIFIVILFFICFIGEFTAVINENYDLGEGNWLAYIGAVLGAGITVIGAFLVTSIQNNAENKKKIKSYSTILINDLRYMNSRVEDYLRLIDDNIDNENFYKIRYLNISENWRELVSYLSQNNVLQNEDITKLYDYFTDIYYITDKYNELHELNLSELDSEAYHKETIRKRKKQVKQEINDKYRVIANKKINDIIEKLNKKVVLLKEP